MQRMIMNVNRRAARRVKMDPADTSRKGNQTYLPNTCRDDHAKLVNSGQDQPHLLLVYPRPSVKLVM